MIELISFLEKEFNIIFSEDDLVLDNFETLEKIVDLIQIKISKNEKYIIDRRGGHVSNIIDLILNEQEEYKVIGYIDKKKVHLS